MKKVWFYLSRAVYSEGTTIEFLLSPMRDAEAAKRFFLKALRPTTDSAPQAHPIEEQMSQPTEARFAPVIADQVRTKRRGKQEPAGMWTRPLSKCMGNGGICIGQLIRMAIW